MNCASEYQKGLEEGKKLCESNQSNTSIANCDSYDATKRNLHINCVKVGVKKYWLDMPLHVDDLNNIYFTISGVGEIITSLDCEKLSETDCKNNSSICKWEPGIFGIGGKCKPK